MEAHPDLLAVNGACNATSGVGDPFLPFREALEMLTGDVEQQWRVGSISDDQARRLWRRCRQRCPLWWRTGRRYRVLWPRPGGWSRAPNKRICGGGDGFGA